MIHIPASKIENSTSEVENIKRFEANKPTFCYMKILKCILVKKIKS